jgi:hypothetical protein
MFMDVVNNLEDALCFGFSHVLICMQDVLAYYAFRNKGVI